MSAQFAALYYFSKDNVKARWIRQDMARNLRQGTLLNWTLP